MTLIKYCFQVFFFFFFFFAQIIIIDTSVFVTQMMSSTFGIRMHKVSWEYLFVLLLHTV